jgi:hypothetical protein
MDLSLLPHSFCLRIRQLTAPPPSPKESYDLSLTVTENGRQSFSVSLELIHRSPSFFRTNSTSIFTYASLSPTDRIDFLLVRTDPRPIREIARLSIPLEWFPKDSLVVEAFHLEPLTEMPVIPVLFVEVHHNFSAPVRRWDAPYRVIAPREKFVRFTERSVSLEFGAATMDLESVSDGEAVDTWEIVEGREAGVVEGGDSPWETVSVEGVGEVDGNETVVSGEPDLEGWSFFPSGEDMMCGYHPTSLLSVDVDI